MDDIIKCVYINELLKHKKFLYVSTTFTDETIIGGVKRK